MCVCFRGEFLYVRGGASMTQYLEQTRCGMLAVGAAALRYLRISGHQSDRRRNCWRYAVSGNIRSTISDEERKLQVNYCAKRGRFSRHIDRALMSAVTSDTCDGIDRSRKTYVQYHANAEDIPVLKTYPEASAVTRGLRRTPDTCDAAPGNLEA